jgi:hypothetical protein
VDERSKTLKYRPSLREEPIRQGEILTGLTQIKLDPISFNSDKSKIVSVEHPFAIVVSQDCDLDWDGRARLGQGSSQKLIPSILFCEIVTAKELLDSILELDNAPNDKKSRTWSRAKINKDERYHFFEAISADDDLIKEGLPELGADFKRYFSIPTDEVYLRIESDLNLKRRCTLRSPYLEHFALRFFAFQSRIALPEEHYSQAD